MTQIKIYHNPRCSKSRKTLALLEQNNREPQIINYLENPPSSKQIKELLKMLNISAQDLLRKNEADYKENIKNKDLSEDELIELMHKFPKVIERPIVVNKNKARIGRPPEAVLEIL